MSVSMSFLAYEQILLGLSYVFLSFPSFVPFFLLLCGSRMLLVNFMHDAWVGFCAITCGLG